MCICSHTAGQVETGRYLKFSDEPACLSQLEALSQTCSGGWLSRHMMCRPLACTHAPTCMTMFIYPSHPRVEECCPLGWAAVTPCSPACLSSHGFCFRAHVTVEENHRHQACQQCGRAEAGGQGGLGLLKNLLAKLQSRVCAVTENIKSHGYKTSPKK